MTYIVLRGARLEPSYIIDVCCTCGSGSGAGLMFEIQDHKILVVQLREIGGVVRPGQDPYLRHLAEVEWRLKCQ